MARNTNTVESTVTYVPVFTPDDGVNEFYPEVEEARESTSTLFTLGAAWLAASDKERKDALKIDGLTVGRVRRALRCVSKSLESDVERKNVLQFRDNVKSYKS